MGQHRATVNGREYLLPTAPTVAITLDGTRPEYLDAALEAGAMPRLKGMLEAGGTYSLGRAHMPTFTNTNNVSIVTGAPPAVHGITGNHYLSPDGKEVQLTDPALLRAETIHAAMSKAGVKVLMVTAKDKLRRLLGAGGVPSVSAEDAGRHGLPEYGMDNVPALVGQPRPGIYDWQISAYALKIGLAVHRKVGLGLLYVSLTDYVQHKSEPGSELAEAFYGGIDALVGEYLDEGFVVGLTADHGMNAKEDPDGSPRVHYLADVLEEAGVRGCRVVVPITDPYVRHHGGLGSFAWIHVPGPKELEAARTALSTLGGVEEVLTRAEASVIYRHPPDRIGDLSVASDAATALGGSRSGHDLSMSENGLRSHGGRHEQIVPIVVSHPLKERHAVLLRAGARNSDLHDLLLNGTEAREGPRATDDGHDEAPGSVTPQRGPEVIAQEPITVGEYQEAARESLPPAVYDYFAGGSGDEATLRENLESFRRIELGTRVLRDVSRRDASTTVLGRKVSMPVMIAPTACHALAHPDGEIATARAAGLAGTVMVLSNYSNFSVEEVSAVATGPVWLQIYVSKDRGRTGELVLRAEEAGCQALVLTADAPVVGTRDRDKRNGFRYPPGLPMKNLPGAPPGGDEVGQSGVVAAGADPALTWEDLGWLRSLTKLPILVKGILDPRDARLSVEHGAAGVVVSNHGGRQLDSAVASIGALPAIAEAVGGDDIEVYLDGGVRRGTDVLKALALGATAVAVGRPVLWGLATDGQAGVERVLGLLREEFDAAMALCGASSVGEIERGLVRTAPGGQGPVEDGLA